MIGADVSLGAADRISVRLDEAGELAERCLELAEREENREAPVSGTAHVAVGQVLYERDGLEDAQRFFEEAVRRAKRGGS